MTNAPPNLSRVRVGSRVSRTLAVVLALSYSGCSSPTSSTPDPQGPDQMQPTTGTEEETGQETGQDEPVGADEKLVARTFRLTHAQYSASVLDLLGVEPDLSNFAPESGNGMFENLASTSFVRVDLAVNYYDVARSLALDLPVAQLAQLTSCDLSIPCRDAFIAELAGRAFRSPVPPEVAARLAAIFELALAESDAVTAYRALVTAILNSPLFLYRKEIGPDPGGTEPGANEASVQLTAHQLAEFLSFSLLDGPPPVWLREQAQTGELNADTLADAVSRLSEEPAFAKQFTEFLRQWAEVTHFDTVEKSDTFPGFAEVKPWFEQEAAAFFSKNATATASLQHLLLDPVPSVDPSLDDFYYSDPSAPATAERLGVLGLGTVLASHAKTYLSSPTLRGTFVRKRFFCQTISLPEGFTPPPISETEVLGQARSTRELYELHFADVTCTQCHRKTDNIGFALEAFDGAGRFRTRDTTQGADVPLNLETQLTDSDVDRGLSGPRDLSQALSESAEVKDCFTRQAFRFYFGHIESSLEVAAITSGQAALREVDQLQGMLEALLSSPTTFERSREPQEP